MKGGGINRKWQRNPRITSEKIHRNHVKLRTNNNCGGGSHIVPPLPLFAAVEGEAPVGFLSAFEI